MLAKRIAAWLAAIAATLTLAACHQGDTAHTLSAIDVTTTSATLRATGHTHDTYYGRYRLDHRIQGGAWKLGTWKPWGDPPCTEGDGTQETFFGSQHVTGLMPGTTYESRLAIDFCEEDTDLSYFDSSNPHDEDDPPFEYHTFRTHTSFGVAELEGQLTGNNIGNVPVETVHIIVKAGEGVGQNPYADAKAHVQMLLAADKLPVTTLDVVDWRVMCGPGIPVSTWVDRVEKFVEIVPSRIIEIGNEPGTYMPNNDTVVRAVWDAYFKCFEIASPIVRAAGKKVILGGNPPGSQGGYLGADDFLAAADAWGPDGIWEDVDGVGLHPYMPNPDLQIGYIAARRQQLTNLGFTGPRSAFFLEFGWGTAGNPSQMKVSEAMQRDHLRDAFTNIRDRCYVAIAWWYSWKDARAEGAGGDWDQYAGVRRKDANGSPKPSYAALQNIANPGPCPQP